MYSLLVSTSSSPYPAIATIRCTLMLSMYTGTNTTYLPSIFPQSLSSLFTSMSYTSSACFIWVRTSSIASSTPNAAERDPMLLTVPPICSHSCASRIPLPSYMYLSMYVRMRSFSPSFTSVHFTPNSRRCITHSRELLLKAFTRGGDSATWRYGFAPDSSRILAVIGEELEHAFWRGVGILPCTKLGSAPDAISFCRTNTLPFCADTCTGLHPFTERISF
mmetsp:Transcript_4895/g.10385  ORF Transcript_4895/g.10385 Transcript_4895/m.10385 type:complete len:220 (+) Transcript_4895:2892-3551(+)